MCKKHGDYEAKVLTISTFSGNPICEYCPKCDEERKVEEDQKKQENMRRLKESAIKAATERSGIPKRFIGKSLDDIRSSSTKQKGVLKTVVNYREALLSGTSASLILCGMPGTGKTHIGCALVLAFVEQGKGARIVTTKDLMRHVKSTYRSDAEHTEEEILEEYTNLYLLVIDEVGVQFGTETEKNIFHEIIDRRYNAMLPTVLISNLPAEELSAFIGERAFDRFKEDGGAVLAFDWESHRGK